MLPIYARMHDDFMDFLSITYVGPWGPGVLKHMYVIDNSSLVGFEPHQPWAGPDFPFWLRSFSDLTVTSCRGADLGTHAAYLGILQEFVRHGAGCGP